MSFYCGQCKSMVVTCIHTGPNTYATQNAFSSEPAYTPMKEFRCNGETTHHQGCECHELRHRDELTQLRATVEHYEYEIKSALYNQESKKDCECCEGNNASIFRELAGALARGASLQQSQTKGAEHEETK